MADFWSPEMAPPSLYIKLTEDAASPPHVRDNAIAAIRPDQVEEITSGHVAMVTQPSTLAAASTGWVEELKAKAA
jgi:hypothetical protein